MSEHHADPGPGPKGRAEKAKKDVEAAHAKQAAARAEAEAGMDQQRAEEVEEKAKAHEAGESGADDADEPRTDEPGEGEAKSPPAERAAKAAADDAEEVEVVQKEIRPKQKPDLDGERKDALALRTEKKAKQPNWRRQEWFRYKKLGGKHAPWRSPRGMHSKQRMHLKYRQNVVSIGYRGPRAARGLHPSGFEEVLVHRPEDLEGLDARTQAARVGGTVGGRKAELIEKEADKLGIRVLNRRS